MTTKPLRRARQIAGLLEAALVVGLPFVKIGGESALRFDVPTLTLHFFGASLRPDEYFVLLAGIFAITFAFAWATLVFGRIWCGWACPQTVLVDIVEDRPGKRGIGAWLKAVPLSALVGANLIWYFVPPSEFFRAVSSADGVIVWTWIVISAIVLLDLIFLGRVFCKTICPYARLQDALFDDGTMVVAFDERRDDECMECAACAVACPVGIDIRDGLSGECIACAKCRDACADRMARRDKPSLIGYFFGKPGGTIGIKKPAAVATLAATFLCLGLVVFMAVSRKQVAALVMPNREFLARSTPDGKIVNSYLLVVTNRAEVALKYDISATLEGESLAVSPATITIKPRGRNDIAIYLATKRGAVEGSSGKATIMLKDTSGDRTRDIEAEVIFSAPD